MVEMTGRPSASYRALSGRTYTSDDAGCVPDVADSDVLDLIRSGLVVSDAVKLTVSGSDFITAIAGVATTDARFGVVHSEPLSKVTRYTLTLINSLVTPSSVVLATVVSDVDTDNAQPAIYGVEEGDGRVVIVAGLKVNFTGVLTFRFSVFK